jgi:putative SOS response-associated peptidase YedK
MASPPEGERATLPDRLPVPLSAEGLAEWLNPEAGTPAQLLEVVLADAYGQAASWQLDPVSAAVGNVRNDGPELIEPISL